MARVLKRKNLTESTGAAELASVMMGYTEGKNVHMLPLSSLKNAPDEWNFFKPLPDDKFLELVESIEKNGLLNPLLVWEQSENEYIILSGHNRKRAIEFLRSMNGDTLYGNVECLIYNVNSLDEDGARDIIVDSNWVQRTLSTAEKAQAVYHKYVTIGRRLKGEGRGYETVAEHFGLKATQVYQYYQLAKLEAEWLEKLDEGKISIKAAAHLARLSKEQRNCLKEITNSRVLGNREILSILKGDSMEDIKTKLIKRDDMRELHMFVPRSRYNEAIRLLEEWMKTL